MRRPKVRRFQFSLRTLVCVHLILGALMGVAIWSWPYYKASRIVESWRGKEFANVGWWADERRNRIAKFGQTNGGPRRRMQRKAVAYTEWQVQIRQLRSVKSSAAVWALRRALREDGPHRRFAIVALGELGPVAAPAIAELRVLLNEPWIRYEAVAALGKIGPQAAPLLREVSERLDTESPGCSTEALLGIGTAPMDEEIRSYGVDFRSHAQRALNQAQASVRN